MKCHKFKIVVILIAMSLSLSLFSTANAVSIYDHVVDPADSLLIVDIATWETCASDFSENWADVFSAQLSSDERESFDDRVAWTVSVNDVNEGSGSYVPGSIHINWWLEDSVLPVATFNGSSLRTSKPSGAGYIFLNQDCTVTVETLPANTGYYIASYDAYSQRYFYKPFIAHGVSIVYPDGYEGKVVPSAYNLSSVRYVAMGDSFSSGEGNPSFEYGVDTSANQCHRSPQAYPRRLQSDSSLDLGPTAFVACSDATTSNVLYGGSGAGSWGEPPQVDALSGNTEVVTITIGGNDVGFGDYAKICVIGPCGPGLGQYAYDAIMDNIDAVAFSQNIQTTYETILEDAPDADVYVLGYPYLFDPTGNDSTGCVVADSSGATAVLNNLNATVALAVAEVRSQSSDYNDRLNYVNTNVTGSPFAERHLCTDDPAGSAFHGITLPDVYSLHPNQDGQQAYYQIIKELID